MKRSEITSLIIVATLSVIIAYFTATALVGSPGNKGVTVKTISSISSEVTQPDDSIFNKDAINPTVKVIIGDNAKGSNSDNSSTNNSTSKPSNTNANSSAKNGNSTP